MTSLDTETAKLVPDWNLRKAEQMVTKGGGIREVRFASYGPNRSTHMMIWSTPDFYEGVLIGQLPRQEVKRDGARVQVIPEHKKMVRNRLIDLDDEEIDLVLECWKRGRSAWELDFIPAVWGRDGVCQVKSRGGA